MQARPPGGAGAGDGHGHPRRWVRHYLEMQAAGSFDADLATDADGAAAAGQVCILDTGRFTFYVPQEVVPEWIDVDADLPVREEAP